MPLILIPILFLALPLVEIGVFILVGREIGVGWTLLLVLLSVVVGAFLLKRQSFAALAAARREAAAGRVPAREMAHGAMIVLAGILLLVPGFVTDVFGLVLFVPPVRDAIWRFLSARLVVSASAGRPGRPAAPLRRPDIVDLQGTEFQRREDPASPWRTIEEDADGTRPRPPSNGSAPNRTLH